MFRKFTVAQLICTFAIFAGGMLPLALSAQALAQPVATESKPSPCRGDECRRILEHWTIRPAGRYGPFATRECFRDHMRHAMAINRERRFLYSDLTRDKSVSISGRLILLENLAKISTYFFNDFDGEAEPYQAQGLNIVCDEFVDMNMTPPYREAFPNGAPSATSYVSFDADEMKERYETALEVESFAGLYREVKKDLRLIEGEPRLNCMMRHTLDSIARIAALAPEHICQANKMNLPTTESLSRRMIESHFLLLSQVVALDQKAKALQVRGVPMICQDVPPIPVPYFPSGACGARAPTASPRASIGPKSDP